MQSILGMGSPLNKFEAIDIELNRNSKTVYVDLGGNDVTGDGSQDKPFKTVARAINEETGTISYLAVWLNDGSHVVKNIALTRKNILITGTGALSLTTDNGNYLWLAERSSVVIDVDVNDEDQLTDVHSFANLEGDSSILFRDGKATMTKVVGRLVYYSYGYCSFSCFRYSFESSKVISKIIKSSYRVDSQIALYELSTAYTNIT
jgi:hypothetical protein